MTSLQFIGSGSNPTLNLKLSKFHENFCIILASCYHFLVNTCWNFIVVMILTLLKPTMPLQQVLSDQKTIAKCFRGQNREMQNFS